MLLTAQDIREYKAQGLEFMLTCSVCDRKLRPGDALDTHFPYDSQYNCCRKCAEKEEAADMAQKLKEVIFAQQCSYGTREKLLPVLRFLERYM